MNPSFKQRFWFTGVIVLLTVVLVVLALLQYRWSGEISEATLVRMRQNLQSSVMSFREGLYQELESVTRGLRPNRLLVTVDDRRTFGAQIGNWRHTSTHPWLVDNIYLWSRNGDGAWQTWKFDFSEGTFKQDAVPAKLSRLQMMLEQMPRNRVFGRREHPAEIRESRPGGEGHEKIRFGGGPPSPPWLMIDQIPALVASEIPNEAENGRTLSGVEAEWVIVELSLPAIQQHILPELAERAFGTPAESTYNVTVTASELGPVLYSSTVKASDQDPLASPDANATLFGPGMHIEGGQQNGPQGPERFGERERRGRPFLMRFDLLAGTPGGDGWRLVAKHRDGSLESAVGSLRRRNLILSFAVLLVLAVTMGLVILFTSRAQRLARLQMDFVTGVSHELRTPLTVISSAADNIADGIVDNKQQLARYGNVIKTQAKQLTGLVEQILLFASTRDKRHQYQFRPLSPLEIVDEAMKSSAGLLQGEGFTVEQDYEKNLPNVQGDLNALCQCLQNLITNAVKYRGSEKWMKVSAKRQDDEVQISIEDHGRGIAPSDLSHIFEPFYRGRKATEEQIHGTGLGLPIAQTIAVAMGGRLTVKSKVGVGSKFTVHLPIIAGSEAALQNSEQKLPRAQMEPKVNG